MRPEIKEDRGFSKKIPERHLGGRPEKEGVLLEQSINETVKELEELSVQTEKTCLFCQKEERKAIWHSRKAEVCSRKLSIYKAKRQK